MEQNNYIRNNQRALPIRNGNHDPSRTTSHCNKGRRIYTSHQGITDLGVGKGLFIQNETPCNQCRLLIDTGANICVLKKGRLSSHKEKDKKKLI